MCEEWLQYNPPRPLILFKLTIYSIKYTSDKKLCGTKHVSLSSRWYTGVMWIWLLPNILLCPFSFLLATLDSWIWFLGPLGSGIEDGWSQIQHSHCTVRLLYDKKNTWTFSFGTKKHVLYIQVSVTVELHLMNLRQRYGSTKTHLKISSDPRISHAVFWCKIINKQYINVNESECTIISG